MSVSNLLTPNNLVIYASELISNSDPANDQVKLVNTANHAALVWQDEAGTGGVLQFRHVTNSASADDNYMDLTAADASGNGHIEMRKVCLHSAPNLILNETVDTSGGAQTVSVSEFLQGYYYVGAAGGGVALTLPDKADIAAALTAQGISAPSGYRLPPLVIDVSDANALTVTAGTGGTVLGTAAVNNTCAVVHSVFTSDDCDYTAVSVVGA